MTRLRGGRVTQRCHNSRDEKRRLVSANDVTHWKRAEDFGDFEESWRVEARRRTRRGRLLGLAEARRICVLRPPREMGAR